MRIHILLFYCTNWLVVTSFPIRSSLQPRTGSWSSSETLLGSSSTAVERTTTTTNIVAPDQSFRETTQGELSVVTFNMLAPFYNSLAIDDWQQREAFAKEDRATRVPLAVQMAKQANGDILCLQEVEGGPELEPILAKLLAEPYGDTQGYDSFLWAPLMPKRIGDVVGLCVAWRSQRHRLVASDCFSRGMICQLAEATSVVDTTIGATFAIANVHLPARPSNILGRLHTMSRTIAKIAGYDAPRRSSPLDGLLMVCGDFNCDETSVTARLLQTGHSPYGNVKDRNYKANVSKAVASQMRHGYRFQNVYTPDVRTSYAPVTVSLTGRGPGCMDQLFYAQLDKAPKIQRQITPPKSSENKIRQVSGKRKSRRDKAVRLRRRESSWIKNSNLPATRMQVDAVLATIHGPDDTERLEIIHNGLPNVEEGFPSDHIPIGALFVANPDYDKEEDDDDDEDDDELSATTLDVTERPLNNGVSSQRRPMFSAVSVRRRHNAVLRCVAEWLVQRGATDVLRDQPLYKNKFAQGVAQLTKKSRAPDLVCVLGNSNLVIVEVTVSANPDAVRQQKMEKYSDLAELLSESPAVQEAGLLVRMPFVILLDDMARIPEETKNDLVALAMLSGSTNSITEEEGRADAQRFCNQLQAMLTDA